MQEIVLVRYGEIILKGLNRPVFESKLVSNIRRALKDEKFRIHHSQARIYIEPLEGESLNSSVIIDKLTRVFGLVSVSPAYRTGTSMEDIYEAAERCMKDVPEARTFKVESKRGDKGYPLTSPEISARVGAHILSKFPDLKVDVHSPEVVLVVEVRENAYLLSRVIPCSGGMPTGTGGKALLLLSGGIDSPAAGWMIARRGVELEAVHFFSPPYTGPKAREKVIDLCRILAAYMGRIRLHIVPFTDIQVELRDKCPEEQLTILMRRFMMRIAQSIAEKAGCGALVTGENLGQVASQTMKSLAASNAVVDIPVFRPLIGMDKNDIVSIAKKINTYETSILPYEDCCTIFLPKRPETSPKLEKLVQSEQHLDKDRLLKEAIDNTEIINI